MREARERRRRWRLRFFGLEQVLPYAGNYRTAIVLMTLLGALSSLFDSIYPVFNRYALTHFIGEGSLRMFPLFIGAYFLTVLFQVLANYISSYLICKVELGIGRDLKNASFRHLQHLSFSYFNTHNVGYIHARVMSDTDRIAITMSWNLMDFVWNFSYIFFAFAVMLSINVHLALLLLMLIPVAAVFIGFFQKRLLQWNRRVREVNARISADYNEGLTGARSIRVLQAAGLILGDFQRDTREMRRSALRAMHFGALFSSTVTFLSAAALALVLWQGGRLSLEGWLEIGSLAVFMSYALGMIEPIQNIIRAGTSLIEVQVNIERFMQLLHTCPDVADSPAVTAIYGDNFQPIRENWEKLRGEVEFRDVSFRYPDGKELVLSHFNLKVPQGSSVAIVGETGAGKSTLVNLVCRFYEPTEGQVLVDGRDLRERSQLWLHANLGYVLQTPHLFSGSVRDNLRYGRPEASDEQIWEALRLVAADEVVERMGQGLDSEVGEGGSLLSTGEKQLLSFARAILADPAILVLDEATSSVDTMTEKKIQEAVRTLTAGRTSFMIAHRLSTVVEADIILAVVDGKIVESGTHRSLMAQKGYYYRLFTRQYEENMTRAAFAR